MLPNRLNFELFERLSIKTVRHVHAVQNRDAEGLVSHSGNRNRLPGYAGILREVAFTGTYPTLFAGTEGYSYENTYKAYL